MDLHNEFEKSKFFHSARIDRRSADALVGLAAGLTADGVVTTGEALFLKQWLDTNLVHLDDPVINLLYSRLSSMLQDNVLEAVSVHAVALLDQSVKLRKRHIARAQVLPLAPAGFVEIQDVPAPRPAVVKIHRAWQGSLVNMARDVRVVLALPSSLHTMSASYFS